MNAKQLSQELAYSYYQLQILSTLEARRERQCLRLAHLAEPVAPAFYSRLPSIRAFHRLQTSPSSPPMQFLALTFRSSSLTSHHQHHGGSSRSQQSKAFQLITRLGKILRLDSYLRYTPLEGTQERTLPSVRLLCQSLRWQLQSE